MGDIRYISDLHLDGRGPFRAEHPEFSDLLDWHRHVVEVWNTEVSPDDIVWVVGDLCLKFTPEVENVVRQLNGHLQLVRGNHDRTDKGILYQTYFEQIVDLTTVIDQGRQVVLCHYPLESWNRKIYGSIHVHGHIHGNYWDLSAAIPNRYNAWATYLGCVPRTLDWFIERYGYLPEYWQTQAKVMDTMPVCRA